MPPVSVTMQPRNLPAAVAELGLLLLVDDELLGADVLFPQAAAISAAATSAALAGKAFFTGYLLVPGHHLPSDTGTVIAA
jgi:hypothetical protein